MCGPSIAAAEPADFAHLDREYRGEVLPLLQRFCLDCHSTAEAKGELNLEKFQTLADLRREPLTWQKVAEMLAHREMPPAESPQLNAAEHAALLGWVNRFLDAEALSRAGDPGPVILRRLTNAEYDFTLQDLTGVTSLHPTREFPVDGAAGEGFTNVGAAQAMSPALVQKYLDAAKEVASHLVLLPDGVTFSPQTTQRDQTDEFVARIQTFYRQYTAEGGGQAVNLQGIKFDTNQGGLLPLESYLAATLEDRAALESGATTLAAVARQRSLNLKYLTILWQALHETDRPTSPLLDALRRQWREARPGDAPRLVAEIAALQQTLWTFHPVGHVGRDGRPSTWMEPVSPLVTRREFRLELPQGGRDDISIVLLASDAGDGREHDVVLWEQPRLTSAYGEDLPLAELAGLSERIDRLRTLALARATDYLAVAARFAESGAASEDEVRVAAEQAGLDVNALRLWLDYLDLGAAGAVAVEGHVQQRHASREHDFVSGWGDAATPIILGNASDREVRIPGIARPHAIVAHPSTTQFIAAGWRSPVEGRVRIEARLADAHPECGNGQEWYVQHRTGRRMSNLGQGEFGTGGSAVMPPQEISVRPGELVSLLLGPRAGNHTCDLTEINLIITELTGQQRTWDLARDCSGNLSASNPHPDAYGQPEVWHFYQGPLSAIDPGAVRAESIPSGSTLARWRVERDPVARAALAAEVRALATGSPPTGDETPDSQLYQQLQRLPISPSVLSALRKHVSADPRFERPLKGDTVAATDLVVQAPAALEFRIPADLAQGRTFVVAGRLEPSQGREGSVRLEANLAAAYQLSASPQDRPPQLADLPSRLGATSPIVVSEGSQARERIEAALAEFRDLFPPALCYTRIVPVDEVVTLTLYYRQDDQLRRLMLEDAQAAELDRLWDELLFVAQEPLKYQVAFEQIREFATQDRPDLVKVWDPLRPLVDARAEAFRQRLREAEPAQLQGIIDFADRAWRRHLSTAEQESLRRFYRSLREAELAHDEALRLTLARILTSPAFLYRREQPGTGSEPVAVTDTELATRLSYFLWSSLPDAELRAAADASRLTADLATSEPATEAELLRQTRRLLRDPRARRFAVHFACQWLHVRDFDQTVEKNEAMFPEFAALKGDLYEETVRFLEDLVREDRSVLSLLDADHTFVNAALAHHYGFETTPGTAGPAAAEAASDWWRVDGVRSRGRGGVLGLATVLASQSGVSRTSPILRGNWVYETLLGERLPRPPANVPQLPEVPPQGLTERELITRHSSVAECAHCHARIDPYGFALEQYDPIGRLRPVALDTMTTLADGTTITGLDGLRAYLLTQRREDFLRHFCRKLLGYALGREVQLSDRPLLDQMLRNLAEHDHRLSAAIETIVLSPQFRSIRGAAAE